jgi:hypothetical protein
VKEVPRWVIVLVEILRWGTGLALVVAIGLRYPDATLLVLRVLLGVLGN